MSLPDTQDRSSVVDSEGSAESATDGPLLSDALDYASRGLPVFPLKPGTKIPATRNGFKDATTDVEQIRRWWTKTPDAGIGLPTGVELDEGRIQFVLDVDVHDPAASGTEALRDLEAANSPLPDGPTALTRSGGAHYYFTAPFPITNARGTLPPGIDVRGAGGYVVVPPTPGYEWEIELGELPIPEAPSWLLDIVTATPERPESSKPAKKTDGLLSGPDDRPGTVGLESTSFPELLDRRGWTPHGPGSEPNSELWTRPGKDPKDGPSATLFLDSELLFVHSTNAPIPTSEEAGSYSKLGFLAVSDFGGDFSAAARSVAPEKPIPANVDPETDAEDDRLELIDWTTVDDLEEPIVEGLAHPGRWTALAAGAKSGKSTILVNVGVNLSRGLDPFDGTAQDVVRVLYVDAEMGRIDLRERIRETGNEPDELPDFFATDLPPLLDTKEGAAKLLAVVDELEPDVVILDGLNGTISGAENDDEPWRALYFWTISPLKRRGIAVVSADNRGHDPDKKRPRGSSVKLDKADAIVVLERTDGTGVKFTTPYRRSSAYPKEWTVAGAGFDGDEPVSYRRTNTAWPDGTEKLADALDRYDVPLTFGRGKAREILAEKGEKVRNDVLAAALRYRKTRPLPIELRFGTGLGTGTSEKPGTVAGTGAPETSPDQGRDRSGDSPGQVNESLRDSPPLSRGDWSETGSALL